MTVVCLVADAGSQVGLGHVQRCLSLASAFKERGMVCTLFTVGDPDVRQRAHDHGCGYESLEGSMPTAEQVIRIARIGRCSAVVVDSYHVDPGVAGPLRAAGVRVILIDDLARGLFSADLVVNPAADPGAPEYRSSCGTRFLLGPQYALLRPEFRECPERTVRNRIERLLVTVGGADPHGLMPKLLQTLDTLPDAFEMTAIIGPFIAQRRELELAASRCRHPVQLACAPVRMRALMEASDMAVSGGGQTLFELAASGTPAVAVQVAANQAGNIAALARHGAVASAGPADQPGALETAGRFVSRLGADAGARRAMSQAGRLLVDGLGAVRVADAVIGLTLE